MKNYRYDEVGNVIHIPTGAVIGVGTWTHTAFLNSGEVPLPAPPSPFHELINDEWVLNKEKYLKSEEQKIRDKYSNTMVQIVAPYSQEERETWKTQEEEALKLLDDSNSKAHMVKNMATTRGIPLTLMIDKILENAALYRATVGNILGQQQKELDDLYKEDK